MTTDLPSQPNPPPSQGDQQGDQAPVPPWVEPSKSGSAAQTPAPASTAPASSSSVQPTIEPIITEKPDTVTPPRAPGDTAKKYLLSFLALVLLVGTGYGITKIAQKYRQGKTPEVYVEEAPEGEPLNIRGAGGYCIIDLKKIIYDTGACKKNEGICENKTYKNKYTLAEAKNGINFYVPVKNEGDTEVSFNATVTIHRFISFWNTAGNEPKIAKEQQSDNIVVNGNFALNGEKECNPMFYVVCNDGTGEDMCLDCDGFSCQGPIKDEPNHTTANSGQKQKPNIEEKITLNEVKIGGGKTEIIGGVFDADKWDKSDQCGTYQLDFNINGCPTGVWAFIHIPCPGLSCQSLSRSPSGSLNVGDSLVFTCTGQANDVEINHYEFQVSTDGGANYTVIDNNNKDGRADYVVPATGSYKAQCRICTSADSSKCTIWGQAGGWTY